MYLLTYAQGQPWHVWHSATVNNSDSVVVTVLTECGLLVGPWLTLSHSVPMAQPGRIHCPSCTTRRLLT